MPKHPKRRTRRNLAVLALSALCLTGFLYWDNTALQVTRFDPVFSDLPAGFDGCRIVVLSDLHGASFGAHNADLLAAVAAEQPEYIFFLGDLEDTIFNDIELGTIRKSANQMKVWDAKLQGL